MLAENLENLVNKEWLEGMPLGYQKGFQEGVQAVKQEVAHKLIVRTEMNDQLIAEIVGLAVDEVSDMRSQVKH